MSGAGKNKTDKMLTQYTMMEAWYIVDVHDMLDHGGNPVSLYEQKKFTTTVFLRENKMIVICCGARHPKSNDIALDVLVNKFGMNFYDIWKLKEKIPF